VRQGDRGRRPSYRTVKGILIAGTETATAAGEAGAAGDVPAFLHGQQALFETSSDHGDLAPVLELPTTSGKANRAAHA
jgi:hypothetical protein